MLLVRVLVIPGSEDRTRVDVGAPGAREERDLTNAAKARECEKALVEIAGAVGVIASYADSRSRQRLDDATASLKSLNPQFGV